MNKHKARFLHAQKIHADNKPRKAISPAQLADIRRIDRLAALPKRRLVYSIAKQDFVEI